MRLKGWLSGSVAALFFLLSSSLGAEVHPGLSVLVSEHFRPIWNKRVGLITNHTAVDRNGVTIIELFRRSPQVELVKIFTPEHGLFAAVDDHIDDSTYKNIPVISLYGKKRKPTLQDFEDIDVAVFDIQDIGARYYTYISTLAYCMQTARDAGKKIIVLDRPNPVGGKIVSGFIPPDELCGKFTTIYPIPTRHGMTVGELARMFNDYFGIRSDLQVIKMKGWKRDMLYSDTQLPWINPSPNMKTLDGAILYAGLGWLEDSNLSMGRGTDIPFEILGAPYINAYELVSDLKTYRIEGAQIEPISFVPTAKYFTFYNKLCNGIRIIINDRKRFDAFYLGLAIMNVLQKRYPDQYDIWSGFKYSIGMPGVNDMLYKKIPPETIIRQSEKQLVAFMKVREQYLLY